MTPPTPSPGPPRRSRRQRTQAVRDALAVHGHGPHPYRTPDGHVVMTDIRVVTDPDGGDVVEVYVADPENGDPAFRVINPPRYVPDPDGQVVLNGRRFREDPLAALAHVVAQHGGRHKDPRRGLM